MYIPAIRGVEGPVMTSSFDDMLRGDEEGGEGLLKFNGDGNRTLPGVGGKMGSERGVRIDVEAGSGAILGDNGKT